MSVRSNKISVIIPTFNRKHLVGETIQNILNQTLVPDEIIVVDDHSEDGTFEHLKSKFSDHIILVENKGKGPGAARNTGFDISTGDYIKFFDSDDLMTFNTIEAQHEILSISGKYFVYSPYFFASQDENKSWQIDDCTVMSYFNNLNDGGLRKNMCRGLFVCIPSMMFKREILIKVGFWPTDIVAYEDWEYLWRISNFESHPAHVNNCAFLYRMHTFQTTKDNDNDRNRDLQKLKTFNRIYNGSLDYFRVTPKLNRLHFLAMMYATWKINKKEKEFSPYKFLDQTIVKIIYFIRRIKFRIGRKKTRTRWQPMHGVYKSCDTINAYLNNINL